MVQCKVCGGQVDQFLDLGRQPLSNRFPLAADACAEPVFPLAVGACRRCGMVQLVQPVERTAMFHAAYPYRTSLSAVMREHFAQTARSLLAEHLRGRRDPFAVEIGSNDGAMLHALAAAGVRHLGVEPSTDVADLSRDRGVEVLEAFFERRTAERIRETHGPADVVFAANTLCHIPYVESIFAGLDALLADDGVFVFEDPYLGDIVAQNSFDQIYDEHFFFFSATSVDAMARRFGFVLTDVAHLPVHGGELRYTLARPGRRPTSPAVAARLAAERARELHDPATLRRFATRVSGIRVDLVDLLVDLRDAGRSVVGFGATAKSATVLNFCGIGPDLISRVHDSTPAKQGRRTPLSNIPIVPATEFAAPYPDVAVLFAWNHAAEIKAAEDGFRRGGGRWVTYVPEVVIG